MAEQRWLPDYSSSNGFDQPNSAASNNHNIYSSRANDFAERRAQGLSARIEVGSYPNDVSWHLNYEPHCHSDAPHSMIDHSPLNGTAPIFIPRPTIHTSQSYGTASSSHSSMIESARALTASPYSSASPSQVFSSSCPSPTLATTPGGINPASLSPADARRRYKARTPSTHTHRRPKHGAKASSMQCSTCKKVLKNTSEAQKHRLQHSKPFKCEDSSCKRHTEGFATKNDLERHRKTVHSRIPTLGERGGYVCVACPEKNKFWPRKDNFRAHCKRRHPEMPHEDLLHKSKTDQKPPTPSIASLGTVPSLTDTTDDQSPNADNASTDGTAPQTNSASQHSSDVLSFGQEDDELVGVGAGPEANLRPSYNNTPNVQVRMTDEPPNMIELAMGDGYDVAWEPYYHHGSY